MTPELERRLAVARRAVREAGDGLRRSFGTPIKVIRKSLHEMVADVDIRSQNVLLRILGEAFPDHRMISEERALDGGRVDGPTWIMDPLDGTHNFIAGLPFWGVSLAYADGDGVQLGLIYFPLDGTLYHAVRGGGAFRDNTAIRVSANDRLDKAVVCYDNQFHLSSRSFENLERVAEEAFTVRILGTATADLCFIATGTVDARVWHATKLVDVAAGSLILREAGGTVTDFAGRPSGLEVADVVASNGHLHGRLLTLLAGAQHAPTRPPSLAGQEP